MVVFMLSVRVFSCMCPDCVACIVFAGFCFFGLSVSVFVRVFCWFWSFCLACIVFVRSFVCPACSVGFGRSVWLVLLRWTGCVLRSGLSGLCVRDGVRLVRPCFSVWSCRPVFPAVRSCPVFLSVLVFFPSSFFRRPLFASDGWRRAAGVRPVRRAGLPFSPCLPLSSSACPAEDDAHALVQSEGEAEDGAHGFAPPVRAAGPRGSRGRGRPAGGSSGVVRFGRGVWCLIGVVVRGFRRVSVQ